MAHSVKIDDKLYVRMKSYCDLNGTSPYIVAKEAIEAYLNDAMYGDAPFMKREEDENRQIYQENPVEIDKNPEKVEKDETISTKTPSVEEIKKELGIKKIEVTPIPSKEAEDKLIEILSTHQYGETNPRRKRRL